MKKQLTKCKSGGLKQFGYGFILVCFFLERVPVIRLQVEWGITTPQDPRMKRWVDHMDRHGGCHIVRYTDVFFEWMRTQMIMVDDYSYAGLYFHGDPDLALPKGSQWGDIGKKEILFI
jgi:hypothetical protein